MFMYYPGHMGWNGLGFGIIWMLLAWLVPVGFVGLVAWLVLRGLGYGGKVREDPLSVLKGRYAKGEISLDEFRRMKDDIEGNR